MIDIELKGSRQPTDDEARTIVLAAIEHLADWKMPSAGLRNGVLGKALIALNPIIDIHEQQEVEFMARMIQKTVKEGHMIDFGFIPNETFKAVTSLASCLKLANSLIPISWIANCRGKVASTAIFRH